MNYFLFIFPEEEAATHLQSGEGKGRKGWLAFSLSLFTIDYVYCFHNLMYLLYALTRHKVMYNYPCVCVCVCVRVRVRVRAYTFKTFLFNHIFFP